VNQNGPFLSSLRDFADIDGEAMKVMIAIASDIALVVSADGIVQDVYFSADMEPANDASAWSGVEIAEIVTEESRGKVADMLARARGDEAPRWREINHRTARGEEFPVRYAAVRTDADGNVILLGRDLRMVAQLQKRLVQAQLTMEQDYERIRQIETRYRVLFETTQEALLIVSSETGRIIDTNTAAARLFGQEVSELANRLLAQRFDPGSQAMVAEATSTVRDTGREQHLVVRTRGERRHLSLDILLFRSVNETLFLCRLTPRSGEGATETGIERALVALYHRAGDAFVITDGGGVIQWANTAFLAMTDAAVSESVQDKSLGDFLGRPMIDLNVMMQNARERGRLSIYATTVRSAYGVSVPVEISATYLADARPEGFGFVLRDVSRAASIRPSGTPVSSDAVENLIDLVGSTPLRELVRGTTDVVEKLCIETALKLTNNNRASAAEMLGLSRQSLYVKLRKYGLIDQIDHED
jgi:transcriptional regulator PpsR